MKKLRAIHILYMALPQETNFTYEYNRETNRFNMISDKDRFCEVECMVDSEDWLIFETELMSNGKGVIHGEVRRVSSKELKEYIKNMR